MPIPDLNPFFDVDDEPHTLLTQEIYVLLRTELGEAVASLDHHHDEATRALDILLIGF